MNRIVEQSRWLIRSGHSEVTIKLQPEHLGEMKLKVVHKDGELNVQMTVGSAAMKHLLDASLNDLRNRLQGENLAQGNLNLNVNIQQGGDGRFAQLAKEAAQDGRAQPVNGQSVEQGVPAASQPAVWGNSNINIYA
jgi:flagellar hook-length control protein FliK